MKQENKKKYYIVMDFLQAAKTSQKYNLTFRVRKLRPNEIATQHQIP